LPGVNAAELLLATSAAVKHRSSAGKSCLLRTNVDEAAINEFRTQRPDCLVCESQSEVLVQLHSDKTITVDRRRGRLSDAKQLFTEARRGPEAFGYVPSLYVVVFEGLAGVERAKMIGAVRAAATEAGYQLVQFQ
jgi:hypothetical protein